MANKLDQFIINAPQVGTIELISYRKERKGDVLIAEQVDISEERGIVNDHYGKKGNRQVTLIQKEHHQVVASMLGKDEIDPTLTRRNIVISGLNLRALIGKRFQLGSEVIQHNERKNSELFNEPRYGIIASKKIGKNLILPPCKSSHLMLPALSFGIMAKRRCVFIKEKLIMD